jgi:hypothetical protein
MIQLLHADGSVDGALRSRAGVTFVLFSVAPVLKFWVRDQFS